MKEIILLGTVQAFFFAFFLFRKANCSFADKLLAANLIAGGLQLTSVLIGLEIKDEVPPLILNWHCGLPLLSALLFFYYVQALTGQISKPNRQFRKHLAYVFAVYLIYLLLLGPIYSIANNEMSHHPNVFEVMVGSIINVANLLANGIILPLALRTLYKHKLLLPNQFSNLENISLGWLQKWLLFALSSYILSAGSYLFYLSDKISLSISNGITGIYASLGIFTLGYFGLKQGIPTPLLPVKEDIKSAPSLLNATKTCTRYKNQLLSKSQVHELQIQIEAFMLNKKPYLIENITISQLAKQVNIPINQLSQYLNEHLHQNFYDFVNSHRVEEVKQMVQDPGKSHLSLLGIALEAGFSSKTTFNRSFKKHTGLTPSVYIKQIKKTA